MMMLCCTYYSSFRCTLLTDTFSVRTLQTTVTEGISSLKQSLKNSEDKDESEDDNGDDMLHNLLGVESATIDQIIDAKGSAASLLGV